MLLLAYFVVDSPNLVAFHILLSPSDTREINILDISLASLGSIKRLLIYQQFQTPLGSIRSLTLTLGLEIGENGFLIPSTQGIQLHCQIEIFSPFVIIQPRFWLIEFKVSTKPFENQEFSFVLDSSQSDLLGQYLDFRVLEHRRSGFERYFQQVLANKALLLLLELLSPGPPFLIGLQVSFHFIMQMYFLPSQLPHLNSQKNYIEALRNFLRQT